jgi:CheY-specific phosphatase CheX
VTPEASVKLVLGELVNMVCGNALGRLAPDGIFRLDSPVGKLGQSASAVACGEAGWIKFPLENGPLFIGLKVE